MRLYVIHMSYVVEELHNMLNKNTTYDKNLHNIQKILDNIYEFLEHQTTYFTQHMEIFHTTHDTNLYNLCCLRIITLSYVV